ncbi:MAG: archemetzincin [Thermoprotei archaeon]|nr:MAG: archemetzincin [Thermoprotei archaeon]
MLILVVPIENPPLKVLKYLEYELPRRLPGTSVEVVKKVLDLPSSVYNPHRLQYDSDAVLEFLKGVELSRRGFRILGVADVDAYSDQLNFVFGQAEIYGRYAVIYLQRLRPEFYGLVANENLFLERALKESMHELGHTFGLLHCTNKYCVMHFSNSIFDTDVKLPKFCTRCLRTLLTYFTRFRSGKAPLY